MLYYADQLEKLGRTLGFGMVKRFDPPATLGRFWTKDPPWLIRWIDKALIARLRLPACDIAIVVDHGNAAYIPALRAKSRIVLCHDLIPWLYACGELKGWAPSRLGRIMLDANAAGLRAADHVVCVSESTRNDLVRILGIANERISVASLGLRQDLTSIADAACAASVGAADIPRNRQFILSFGTAPYKNMRATLEIFERALPSLPRDILLVMLGVSDEKFRNVVNASSARDRILLPQSCDDRLLASLYRRSLALLFPSVYEGFGMPILEAQWFGVPVVASTAPAIVEVSGQGALLFNPTDIAAGAAHLISAVTSNHIRDGLIAAGAANVRRYTPDAWIKTWRGVLARYA
jgi:glycosyltransferase involved in cell wall biosynthesis